MGGVTKRPPSGTSTPLRKVSTYDATMHADARRRMRSGRWGEAMAIGYHASCGGYVLNRLELKRDRSCR
eukprot:762812-Prymnesium_polylepis.1